MKDIEFIWAGGYTERYHTTHTILRDTVGHHSFNVAAIIMTVWPDASAKLLRAALLHDVAEHKTGDMPAPAKRAMGIREVFSDYEQEAMAYAGVSYPELTPEEEWALKYADALDGMRFCVQERAMGNRLIDPVYYNFRDYVEELLLKQPHPPVRAVQLFNHMKGGWNDAVR